MLEGIANFTEVKGSKVTVAFVIPFWSASSAKERKINVSKKKLNMNESETKSTITYFVSTLERCMIRDLPLPQGSMR